MVEDLAASYIALKLENEILQAQVQRLMEENAALQAQIPELQKAHAAKGDEPLQKPSEAQEPQKPPEPQALPATWEFQESPEIQEPQEPPKIKEPQESPEARAPPATWEFQESPEIQEPQEPPEIKESQESPEAQAPPATWGFQKPPEINESQEPPEIKEPQESPETLALPATYGFQEPPEIKEPQKPPEALALPATLPQEPLEPRVPQEPLDPSDTQEFLELSAPPQESLEGLIVVETSDTSEFPQAPSGLEVAALPLEYPLAFNGDAQKLPEFLIQLNSYMRVRGHLYPTEAALVSFVGNRFSGEAGRWFQPLLDIQSPLLEQFESFIQVLLDTFDNPENLEDANHHIRQLCQGEGSIHQYATHFHLIAQELNWDESTLCIQFQEGLASSILNELSLTSSATNLSNLITQCVSLEEKLSGEADPNPPGASPSEDRDGPESPPAENQPVQAVSNRPHLSEAERARRREGHLCLYCGHPGHFARDCPVKPQRAQQAGNIEARR
ncbi:Zinc finger CCHC domain-containing protein 5 [Sciurus carolinensis]|uniref:Zinc finger CCHC domain-containing protein 5 n=1 Tax=Sciurus carolinensis TaxID=30640 RepID=A0AA41N1H3_SCICA|nr:Zinc finger CCHC domain-containing protein 5 [Sciurus carolinensis]